MPRSALFLLSLSLAGAGALWLYLQHRDPQNTAGASAGKQYGPDQSSGSTRKIDASQLFSAWKAAGPDLHTSSQHSAPLRTLLTEWAASRSSDECLRDLEGQPGELREWMLNAMVSRFPDEVTGEILAGRLQASPDILQSGMLSCATRRPEEALKLAAGHEQIHNNPVLLQSVIATAGLHDSARLEAMLTENGLAVAPWAVPGLLQGLRDQPQANPALVSHLQSIAEAAGAERAAEDVELNSTRSSDEFKEVSLDVQGSLRQTSEALRTEPASPDRDLRVLALSEALREREPESALAWAGEISYEPVRASLLRELIGKWHSSNAAELAAWLKTAPAQVRTIAEKVTSEPSGSFAVTALNGKTVVKF